MAGVAIREAGPDDAELPARLAFASDAFYHEHFRGDAPAAAGPDAIAETADRIRSLGIGRGRTVEALIAEADGVAVGSAFFGTLFPADENRPSLFLKDLHVDESRRGLGVGRALMRALAALAVARGCVRMDWNTLDWNTGSIAFYESLGAVRRDQAVMFRLDRQALRRIAAESADPPD